MLRGASPVSRLFIYRSVQLTVVCDLYCSIYDITCVTFAKWSGSFRNDLPGSLQWMMVMLNTWTQCSTHDWMIEDNHSQNYLIAWFMACTAYVFHTLCAILYCRYSTLTSLVSLEYTQSLLTLSLSVVDALNRVTQRLWRHWLSTFTSSISILTFSLMQARSARFAPCWCLTISHIFCHD